VVQVAQQDAAQANALSHLHILCVSRHEVTRTKDRWTNVRLGLVMIARSSDIISDLGSSSCVHTHDPWRLRTLLMEPGLENTPVDSADNHVEY
jgi:hypothetical protein